jgi:hypothetical protein
MSFGNEHATGRQLWRAFMDLAFSKGTWNAKDLKLKGNSTIRCAFFSITSLLG